MRHLFLLLLVGLISSCTGVPKNLDPVTGFETERYLGTWYEIARLDHRFERGLNNVTATYSLRNDGGLVVKNRGYATADAQWKEATGKAYFVGDESVGHLKVSFFGPIYASYVIWELEQTEYQHAFVSGHNTKNLWLLSREPTVSDALIDDFKQRATDAGFDLSGLIMVDQTSSANSE